MKKIAIATFAVAVLASSFSAKAEPVLSYWGGYIPQQYELTAWGTWVPACDKENLAPNVCENEDVVILPTQPAPKPSPAF